MNYGIFKKWVNYPLFLNYLKKKKEVKDQENPNNGKNLQLNWTGRKFSNWFRKIEQETPKNLHKIIP